MEDLVLDILKDFLNDLRFGEVGRQASISKVEELIKTLEEECKRLQS